VRKAIVSFQLSVFSKAAGGWLILLAVLQVDGDPLPNHPLQPKQYQEHKTGSQPNPDI